MQNKLHEVIKKYGIKENEFLPYEHNKGKVDISLLNRVENENSKLILVTAINPTKAGEGKTTVSIGLCDGLNRLNKNAILALREPSLGPVFGMKGGATGGGKSSITPKDDINLHFTGDFHAITSAHNLLSALIDAHIFHGNKLKINKVVWPRTIDMNDRSLRNIETDIRKDGFIITAASEIMAVLALSSSILDLKNRLKRILIGFDVDNSPIFVKDLKAENAMTILLKAAINPNVVLTEEDNLAFVHAGPFANIAHGCNSILATKMALALSDYCITEAGFGADLGMEKFLDIKVPVLKKNVDAIVLVATIRALKVHGGAKNYSKENLSALFKGFDHLTKHIENIKRYNVPYVIAINKFDTDTDNEINALLDFAKINNHKVALCEGFNKGGEGMIDLANNLLSILEAPLKKFKPLYNRRLKIEEKIEIIAKNIYGANDVEYSKKALENLRVFDSLSKNMPICVAKTPHSFSGDADKIGVPKNFILKIQDIKLSNGAGFIVALTKGIMIMPGLNEKPRALRLDLDENNNIVEKR